MAHAVGDRAVRMSLDAFEHAARSNPASDRGRRHRVEHLETTTPPDLLRFGSLGVIASLQPLAASPRASWLDGRLRTVGTERASRGWAYRSISTAAGRLAFGSDWPSEALDPLAALNAAVGRRATDSLPSGDARAPERLRLTNAIDAYTRGAAWASFDEQRKGSLEPGMLADLVVLSANIFATPDSLATARVAYTIFDGRVVYSAERGTN
jgi:hypothetical protein